MVTCSVDSMAEQSQRASHYKVLLGLPSTVVGISGLKDGHGINAGLIRGFPGDWYLDSKEKKIAFSI